MSKQIKYDQSDIQTWPKLDLHRHLEGSLRPQTILTLLQKNSLQFAGSPLHELLPHIQVTGNEKDLFDFLRKIDFVMSCLKKSEDLELITMEAIDDASADGVIYLELRFSPHYIASFTGLDPYDIVLAIVTARNQAERIYPIFAELTLIVPQYGGKKIGDETIDLALEFQNQHVSSLDIAGDIRQVPLVEYKQVFSRAAREGLGITVHAGEITPADTVALAVEELHANRIGHGIRAIDDHKVLKLLKERGVLLEICVTSNLQTRAVSSLKEHPIRMLFDQGIDISINSDDPGISKLTLSDEYKTLLETLSFTKDELLSINKKAIQKSFCSVSRKLLIDQRF